MKSMYRSCVAVSCFDDASDAIAAAAAALAADQAAAALAAVNKPATPPAGKVLTQDEFNAALAREINKERAKHEATLKQTLESKNLTDTERAALKEQLEIVQGEAKTKEVRAAEEKKALETKYKTELEAKTKEAESWASLFRESNVVRDLQDAAVTNDAYSPDQIVTLLKSMTKMVEIPDEKNSSKGSGKYRTVVEFPDKDPVTGEIVPTAKTPEEAVKRMKELPEKYGNLFKSNVVSGIGANSSAGPFTGAGGKVDLKRLAQDPKAFRDAIKANPGLLNTK